MRQFSVKLTVIFAAAVLFSGCGSTVSEKSENTDFSRYSRSIEEVSKVSIEFDEASESEKAAYKSSDIIKSSVRETVTETQIKNKASESHEGMIDSDPETASTETITSSSDVIKTSESSVLSTVKESQKASSTAEISAAHEHIWVPRYETVYYPAVYETITAVDQEAWDETVTDQEAWEEDVYEMHEFCSVCDADLTAMPDNGDEHQAPGTGHMGYYTKQVIVNTIHHDAVTHIVHHEAVTHLENRLVKEAYTEQVQTGYICPECGASK